MSVDGPSEHRAAIEVLDEAGEFARIAVAKLVSCDSFIEHFLGFITDGTELREGDGMKVWIGQIVLEPSQAVGHSLGRGCERSAVGV